MTDHLPYWLAATYLPIAPRKLKACIDQFADIDAFFKAPREALLALKITDKGIDAIKQVNWRLIDDDVAWLQASTQHHLVTFDDPLYPKLLKEISDPPLALYVRGDKLALTATQIAMVGSRHASTSGLATAESFAKHLADAGFAITSGLAEGVDARSHRGALAAKGVTLGVCGTGLKHIYPSAHKQLGEQIVAERGALVSEFPLTTTPHAMHFPRRNRIIAGLSIGVLVVEAALKSGSLITARHALEQGREVFAIPGSIHHPLARGCHHLIRQGAKLVETANDILEELGSLRAVAVALKPDLPPEQGVLLALIGHEMTPLDVILFRSRLTAGEVSSILLSLELNGYVQSVPGGYARVSVNS
jgi:DNA processing protein